ncbi:MAG TPA: peptidoglycan-binding domain-containing protein, partial [Pyrinomonadaceae bacterium]|nr:peptidoglycan-binding domain-containing protein [Pyrinomonadaceae bacterium]
RTAGMTDESHFETCAICKKGTDANAYYGCVSWGYEIDALDKFTEDKFERVSKGTPSSEFLAAAKKWNDQTAPVATDDLPLPTHSTRNTHMKLSDLDAEIKSLDTKLKGLAAGSADIPQVTFELRVLRDIRDAIKYNEDQGYLKIEIEQIQKKVGAQQDGQWGYDTVRLVKIWQARNGLTADGRVGPTTLQKMGINRVGDYPLPDTSPAAPRPV